MKPSGTVLAIGEILWDLLPAGPRLGGTTANFAIGCSRLGHRAALISCVGVDQRGRDALGLLAAETEGLQFDLSMIQSTETTPTGTVSVLLGPNGQPEYGISTPAAWDEIRLLPQSLAAAGAAAAICFGTLAQREIVSRATIRALVAEAGPECLRVLDINVRQPFISAEVVHWSLRHADIIKISEEELALVCRLIDPAHTLALEPEASLADAERAAHLVLDFAPECRLVAITRGPLGSLLITRESSDAHSGFPIQVEDTVGAGDAFTTGLVHAMLNGASLPAMNRAANLCGSYVASHPGATPPFSAVLLQQLREALA